MRTSSLLFQVFRFLIFPSVLFTLALYLYPIFFGCNFALPQKPETQCYFESKTDGASTPTAVQRAPFRLLAFGDPQLEGDSSLPAPDEPWFPAIVEAYDALTSRDARTIIHAASVAVPNLLLHDVPRLLQSSRKRLDLWGNDLYLAHIYWLLHWWTAPTHVTVLGDLLGSQWVSDDEFERRGRRYWDRVFKHGTRVEDWITTSDGLRFALGEDPEWSRRIMNVAGNHDIGYAGDLSRDRMSRFERMFGKANYVLDFTLDQKPNKASTLSPFTQPPALRIVLLNSMNLDSPVLDTALQQDTYDFINGRVISTSRSPEDKTQATVLLTHIPLYKKAGICVDAPFFDYGESGIREQNQLSQDASRVVLESIYGMSGNQNAPRAGLGRTGIILNGHDHEGCETFHHLPRNASNSVNAWETVHIMKARSFMKPDIPGIREITVRSMMGSYGGNAGMLSGWFDADAGEWHFAYEECLLGVQHFWWAVHVLDIVTASILLAAIYAWRREHEAIAAATKLKKGKQMRAYSQGREVEHFLSSYTYMQRIHGWWSFRAQACAGSLKDETAQQIS